MTEDHPGFQPRPRKKKVEMSPLISKLVATLTRDPSLAIVQTYYYQSSYISLIVRDKEGNRVRVTLQSGKDAE